MRSRSRSGAASKPRTAPSCHRPIREDGMARPCFLSSACSSSPTRGSSRGCVNTNTRLTPILLTLTATTGIVDAVSYLALGRVFTANMTGNIVLLGFAVSGAPGLSIPRSLTALLAFLAGAVVGGRIALRMGRGPQHVWAGVGFGAEAMLLIAAAAVSIGPAVALSGDATRIYGV